jgi:hypothetical protein
VAPGPDRIGWGVVRFEVEETVEAAQGGQPAVDGGNSVTEAPAMGDVGIHVVAGDGRWGLVRPGEKELHIAGVVDVGGSVGTPAAQPLVESFDLWKHTTPPDGRMAIILPSGGWSWNSIRHPVSALRVFSDYGS